MAVGSVNSRHPNRVKRHAFYFNSIILHFQIDFEDFQGAKGRSHFKGTSTRASVCQVVQDVANQIFVTKQVWPKFPSSQSAGVGAYV